MTSKLDSIEERIALRLSQLEQLKPPVDVRKLAESRANFRERRFPTNDVDGLCFNLKTPGTRPTIWLNSELGYHRKRFTLAHEIGHLVIPWHTGSIVDELDAADSGERSTYRKMEAEANRFAAELLMPRQWCSEICRRAEHMSGAMHTIIELADVSKSSAALRTAQCGPPGYLVAAVREELIFWSDKTTGTECLRPPVGTQIDAIDIPTFYPPEIVGTGKIRFYWWKAIDHAFMPEPQGQHWRVVLERILMTISPESRPVIRQRINAIVGYALGRLPRQASAEELYTQGIRSLHNRTDRDTNLIVALSHPEMEVYIRERAYEYADARR